MWGASTRKTTERCINAAQMPPGLYHFSKQKVPGFCEANNQSTSLKTCRLARHVDRAGAHYCMLMRLSVSGEDLGRNGEKRSGDNPLQPAKEAERMVAANDVGDACSHAGKGRLANVLSMLRCY